MALTDEFTARYSADYVLQITNPDLNSASSADTDRLGYAAADATGMFQTYVGVTYDNTDAQHLDLALELVDYKLRVYARGPSVDTRREEKDLIAKLKALGLQLARFAPLPQSTSNLVPTRETTDREVRPTFDRANMRDMLPNAATSNLSRDGRSYD